MDVTKQKTERVALRKDPTALPKTIKDIPAVWLVRSEIELRLWPKLRTLDINPQDTEPRLFVVASIREGDTTRKIMRLSSFDSDLASYSHEWLWIRTRAAIYEISPSAKVEPCGGGYIYATDDDKVIHLKSKSSHGPADVHEGITLIKEALRGEYSGYEIRAQILGCHIGDIDVDQGAMVSAKID
ncbi:MAG: hypothetical protein KGH94_04345 [Candidatus Micrarchaeota archaeon]|nr:hypothetical protein [Candidatus Micrarchaeota archaeon]